MIQNYWIFNNISYYQASSLQEIESKTERPWFRVLSDGTSVLDWQFWLNTSTWGGMLIISSSDFYGINPENIYKTYMGTNKIIVDDGEGLIYQAEKIKAYTNAEWSTTVSTPV